MTNTDVANYRVLSADELNATVSFEEALAQSGLTSEQIVVVASPYTVLNKDKGILVDNPFFIRNVRFATDEDSGNEYAVFYAVTRANEMYVVTDGSTGIRAQLKSIVAQREKDGHPTPTQNFLVANGLRVSEYGLNADNKPAKAGEKVTGKASTYYLG